MQRNEIVDMLVSTLKDYFDEQAIVSTPNENTALFGSESLLDSMGLVHIVVEVESKLRENGIDISLISESAMSQRNSPFRTISTLADFILNQLA